MKAHIDSLHKGKKYVKCDSCGKTFSQVGNLKTHINSVHNGQKDHKYDSCLVKNRFQMQETWRDILIEFIKVKKISNVTYTSYHGHDEWRQKLSQMRYTIIWHFCDQYIRTILVKKSI